MGDVSLHLQTLEADLSLHQQRLDALNALFHVQTQRLTTLRSQYRRSVDVLNHRLVDIYESDDPSTLDILFGSRSIQDAIDRVQALSEINAQDRAVSAAVSRAKTQVTAARKKTKRLRSTVNAETAVIRARTDQTRAVRDELVGARNDLSDSKQQKLQDLSTLTASERASAEEIDALQAASARIAAQIRAAQSRNTGPTQTPSNAGLIWPVQGPVTSPFGWRWGRMHEGIDIGVGYGTPIHAAAGGTVIYCGWEERLRQPRRHRPRRQPRDGVRPPVARSPSRAASRSNQGDVIGYVGCTGHCFGPHLHFEVRVNGQPGRPARLPRLRSRAA